MLPRGSVSLVGPGYTTMCPKMYQAVSNCSGWPHLLVFQRNGSHGPKTDQMTPRNTSRWPHIAWGGPTLLGVAPHCLGWPHFFSGPLWWFLSEKFFCGPRNASRRPHNAQGGPTLLGAAPHYPGRPHISRGGPVSLGAAHFSRRPLSMVLGREASGGPGNLPGWPRLPSRWPIWPEKWPFPAKSGPKRATFTSPNPNPNPNPTLTPQPWRVYWVYLVCIGVFN